MANNYESLKTDGHYTLAYRIFLKMRNWVQSKVQTDVPANAVFTDTLPMAYCDTNADTTAKVAKCTNFSLKNNSFISINFKNGNTVTGGTGVTLNINNTGAKPVYVDFDDDSVPTDEPFDAGTYILYYTNQAYYLYTNGVLYPYRDVAKQNDLKYYSFGSQDGSVTIVEGSSSSGGATTYTENFLVQKVNGHTVNSDVPSNAVFTDHKSTVRGYFNGMLVSETVDKIDFLNTDFTVSPGITVQGSSFSTVSLLHSLGTDVPSNAVFTDTTYTAGDNVNISQQNVISADQIDDSYNYQQYQNLPSSTKMQDKLFIVDDAPDLDPAILNLVYPIGTYYETSDTTFNPNVTWGGTWVLETEGLVHISSGTNYVVSANAQDGGNSTINLQHSHTLAGYGRALIGRSSSALTTISYKTGGASSAGYKYDRQLSTAPGIAGVNTTPTDTSALEGGTSSDLSTAQSIMQPYKIVNRWHRTA